MVCFLLHIRQTVAFQRKTYVYTTGTLGAVQSTETRAYGNSNWIDQLTNINGTDITYDEMGNPLSWHNASELEWEGRKLKSFKKDGLPAITYTYNDSGIRTSKTVNNEKLNISLTEPKSSEKSGTITLLHSFMTTEHLLALITTTELQMLIITMEQIFGGILITFITAQEQQL